MAKEIISLAVRLYCRPNNSQKKIIKRRMSPIMSVSYE